MYRPKLKCLLCLLFTAVAVSAFAQTSKEDKDEKKAMSKQKVEYNVFRRQILTLQEFGDERRKIAELQKGSKLQIKLVAYVDSGSDADDKTLTGYIRENVGEDATDIYEVTYDRALKRITAVKATGETVEIDKDEQPVKKHATAAKSKTKQKGGDDEDEVPAAKKKKSKKEADDDDE